MGANSSEAYVNTASDHRIKMDLILFRNGSIDKSSLQYKLLLMCGRYIIDSIDFYRETEPNKIAEFVHDMGALKLKEAQRIYEKIVTESQTAEEAQYKTITILSQMRVSIVDKRTKSEYAISPLVDEDLFNDVVKKYKTKNGIKFFPQNISFDDPQIQQISKQQMVETLNQINHTRSASLVVLENPVQYLWEKNVALSKLEFNEKPKKPVFWKKSIHEAAFNGDESSVEYTLYILPLLLNCPDAEGNTPTHKAAQGGECNMIIKLKSLGADFRATNDEGLMPLHLSSTKNAVQTFKDLGFDIFQPNENGETLLELKTKYFDKKILKTLLEFGTDIFTPNSKGIYWMQYAIHGNYYGGMTFVKFQDWVRRTLKKVESAPYIDNPLFKEITERNVDMCEQEDVADLEKSITNNQLDRVKALAALGANLDRQRTDGITNLVYCALNDLSDIAAVLACNYCDPNQCNSGGENTFWISAINGCYSTATIMKQCGADMNALSHAGKTALHVAYEMKRAQSPRGDELFDFLLKSGASPNTPGSDHCCVTYIAFSLRDDVVAEMLQSLYHGDINSKAKDGNTLAHDALIARDKERLDYLIGRGADLNVKNDLSHSVFMTSIIAYDDIEHSGHLLEKGSDINTQDKEGNTPLMLIAKGEPFNRPKFDFLVINGANIDIENNSKEFVIGVLIGRQLNDEATLLLERGANLLDPKSYYEPIVIALQQGNQYWTETLLLRGANAMNETFGVLTHYINSPFFSFEIMRMIQEMNLLVEAPLQAALVRQFDNVAQYIWDCATPELRVLLSEHKDFNERTPLLVSLTMRNARFVDYLIQPGYDVKSFDTSCRTPFAIACESNILDWMKRLWALIDVDNANIKDVNNVAALTYVANNAQTLFANEMFCAGVNVNNIAEDTNGIVLTYQKLLDIYNSILSYIQNIKNKADSYESRCRSSVSKHKSRISSLKSSIHSLESRIRMAKAHNQNTSSLSSSVAQKKRELSNEESKLRAAQAKLSRASTISSKYKQKFRNVSNSSRSDILYRIKSIKDHAVYDGDIPSVSHPQLQCDISQVADGLCFLGINL